MGRAKATNSMRTNSSRPVRRGVLFAAVCALALVLLPAVAAADSKSISSLRLDAYRAWDKPQTPTIATGARLKAKQPYVATVRGTIGYYAAINYVALQAPWKVICGAPKSAPMFTAGGGSGAVGNDAEYIFAQPQATACAGKPLPTRWYNFEANAGKAWKHPNVLSAKGLTGPRPNHTYDYAITGEDKSLKFRLVDPDTRDNYGRLLIDVRTAVAGDCTGDKYKAWGYPSQQSCVAATRDNGKVSPRSKTPAGPAIEAGPIARVLRDSDVPGATNRELPSGALLADGFVSVNNTKKANAAAELKLLKAQGVRSTAISGYAGTNQPTWKSAALKLGSAAKAQTALSALATLHAKMQAPAGTTATATADPAFAKSRLLTFKLTAGGKVASIELLVAAGNYVYTLQTSGPPDTVSQAATEQLMAAITARS